MTIEDHIWNLTTKKLSNEASEQELLELDSLLQQYPDINRDIEQLFNWWYYDEERNPIDRGEFLFNKIQERIKQAEQKDRKQ